MARIPLLSADNRRQEQPDIKEKSQTYSGEQVWLKVKTTET